jgi:hypothetical protein
VVHRPGPPVSRGWSWADESNLLVQAYEAVVDTPCD